jgi:hypothetical protein
VDSPFISFVFGARTFQYSRRKLIVDGSQWAGFLPFSRDSRWLACTETGGIRTEEFADSFYFLSRKGYLPGVRP